MEQLTKAQVIQIASDGYPDDAVACCYVPEKDEMIKDRSEVGDGLAYFIAHELKETLDDVIGEHGTDPREDRAPADEMLNEAINRIEQARDELTGVIGSLEQAALKLVKVEGKDDLASQG